MSRTSSYGDYYGSRDGASVENQQQQKQPEIVENEQIQEQPHFVDDIDDKPDPPLNSPSRVCTIPRGTIDFICTSMNATVLSIPFIFSKLGVIVAPVIIIAFGLATTFCLSILSTTARKVSAAKDPEIVTKLCGLTASTFIVSFVFLSTFGLTVGFLILLRDISTDTISLLTRHRIHTFWPLFVGTALGFPIMLFRNIFGKRYFCYISLAAIVAFTVYLLYVMATNVARYESSLLHAVKLGPNTCLEVVETLPIIAVLYFPHFSMLSVHSTLQVPTKEQMFTVIAIATTTITVIYLIIGYAGYFLLLTTYGHNHHIVGNILFSLPATNEALLFCRFMILIVLIITPAVYMIPARELAHSLYHLGKRIKRKMNGFPDAPAGSGYSQWQEQHPQSADDQDRSEGGILPTSAPAAPSSSSSSSRYYAELHAPSHSIDVVTLGGQRAYVNGGRYGAVDTSTGGDNGSGNIQTESEKQRYLAQRKNPPQQSSRIAMVKNMRDVWITLILILSALLIALYVPLSIITVWQFVGSVFVLPAAIVFPCVLYILLGRRFNVQRLDSAGKLSYAVAILTCLLIPFCAVATGMWI